jgi:hypothetical protein
MITLNNDDYKLMLDSNDKTNQNIDNFLKN